MHYRVFTKKGCGTCRSVVSILRSRGVDFSEVDVATDGGLRLAQYLGVTTSGAIVDENDKILTIDDLIRATAQPANA